MSAVLVPSRIFDTTYIVYFLLLHRHADVMVKIIQMVADGGGELGVHMYPFTLTLCHVM